MIYLTNAFSVSMARWPRIGVGKRFQITRSSAWSAGEILRGNDFVSAYGHESTAQHLRRYLKIWVPVSRDPIELKPEDTLIIARAGMDREFRTGMRRAPKWSFYMVKLLGEVSHEDSA